VLPDVTAGRAQFKSALNQARLLRTELVLKLRNADQFQKCLDAITDPTSPYYGQFLNATTLKPYLPTPGQRLSIIQYLTRHGFNVTSGPSPIVLNVAGSVSVIQHVFGLKLGIYQENTNSSFYAADSDPTMPQNLAALVNGITGLDNYTTIRPADQSVCLGPYCPQGIQVGYSLSGLFASGYDGTGQKVAIVDAPGDPNIRTAITKYSTQYGLAPISLDIRYPDGVPLPSSYDPLWASETAMDVEAVHAVAPGAGIVLLYGASTADDLMNAIDYVASNHLANIVSNSWTYACNNGSCSDTQLQPPSLVSETDFRLAFDAAQGLTILFASGDEGARPDGSTLGTEFPSSDPNVLAVGATNLVLAGCGTSICTGYGSETGASISGGGYSGYFAEPAWQTTNIGLKSGRAVPDVSMLGFAPGFWVYSTISAGACKTSSGQAGWFACAGTSLSTALWAGFLAIVLQIRGGAAMGNINPKIYQLANSASYSSYFHDVTSGSNGYAAGVGWDPVTGWGTPMASNLAYALGAITITVTSNPPGSGYATVDSTPTITPHTFSWMIGSTHTLSANSPVGCGSGCQYVYSYWSDGGSQSHTIIVSAFTTTYTANFIQQFMLTTGVDSGLGSVSPNCPSPSDCPEAVGSSVTLTAIPAIGWSFSNWSTMIGETCSTASCTFIMPNNPVTLRATFVVANPPQAGLPVGVVRGLDNGIYFNWLSGSSWVSWTELPGATVGSPAGIECGGQLYFAVQGTDNGIWFGSLSTSTGAFSGWSQLPGATTSGPGLAADSSCNLYIAVRGMDNGIYLNTYTSGAWQGWTQLPGATPATPSVAVYAGSLWVSVEGMDHRTIWVGQENLGLTIFSGWIALPGATPSGPRLAVDAVNNVLYLAVRGLDNRIYLSQNSGSGWSAWSPIASGLTVNSPSILINGGFVYVEVQGTDNGIYVTTSPTGSSSWSSWTRLPGATISGPTLA
jgi:kumamolisin